MLGISLDTLRRWDRAGRIETARDSGNRRIVAATELRRLRGEGDGHLSARNRLNRTGAGAKVEGLTAQAGPLGGEPGGLGPSLTADAVEDLGLKPGMPAVAVVKAT